MAPNAARTSGISADGIRLIDLEPVARIGLIAGNGRFPFLVLQGARSLGHDVTVVAVKEEAFPELEAAAARRRGRPDLGLPRPPG